MEAKELFDWLDTSPDDLGMIADRCHMIAGSAAAFGQADLREALVQVERHADAGDQPAMIEAIRLARKAWKEAPAPSVG